MSTGDPTVDAHIARLAEAAPAFDADQSAFISGLLSRTAQQLRRDPAAVGEERIPAHMGRAA